MKRLLLITAGAMLVATPLFAQATYQQLLADANLDDKVTAKEYIDSRRTFLMKADTNRDGRISQTEWTRGATHERHFLQREGVAHADIIGKGDLFTRIDANKDGFVTPAEIDTVSAARFPQFDLNKDGAVTRKEAEQVDRTIKAEMKKK